jgi:hypothetical protein
MAYIPDCTLTTACYDLSKYSKNARTKEETINLFDSLFRVPVYLVIYCDKTIEPIVKETREKYKLEKLTKIIVQEFEELWCWQFAEKLRDNFLKIAQCHRSFPERSLLFFNKMDFVKQTIINNPFNTTKFGWIDSGLYKDGIKICENNFDNLLLHSLKHAPNKFHLTIMNVEDKKFKLDINKKEFYSQPRYVVVGCLFTTPADIGLKILNRMEELIAHTINIGYGGTDEHIYLEILDEFYDDIYRSYGDYQQTLHNFIKPTKNLIFIYWNIVIKYFNFGYYKECIDACYSIISSFDEYQTDINFDLYVRIYSALYLSLVRTHNNQATIVADTIRKYYNTHPTFQLQFNNLKNLIGMTDFEL